MKILFVQADRDAGRYKISSKFFIPSLTLEQLIASTPEKYEIKIVNEWYEKVDFEEDCHVVAISSFTKDAYRAYELAKEFKMRGKKVILGGYHPTALPQEAKRYADAVVIGEAEESWPQLLRDLERDKLKPFYFKKARKIPPAKRIRHPFFSALQATRGCPYKCEFCQLTGFKDNIHRKRPIPEIVSEIKSIKNKIFWFHDASLTIDPKYTKHLLKEIIRNKIKKKWIAFGNLAVLSKDIELIRLAKKAGCIAWMVGLETISQKTIDTEIKKGGNKIEKVPKTIEKIEKEGMEIWASFIFGFDNDTPDIFDKTLEKLNEWGIKVAEFNVLTPFPKTPIFKKFVRENRIFSFNWSKYDLNNVVFTPKKMEEKELENGIRKLNRKFLSLDKIIKRTLLANHKIFTLLANLSLRKINKCN